MKNTRTNRKAGPANHGKRPCNHCKRRQRRISKGPRPQYQPKR